MNLQPPTIVEEPVAGDGREVRTFEMNSPGGRLDQAQDQPPGGDFAATALPHQRKVSPWPMAKSRPSNRAYFCCASAQEAAAGECFVRPLTASSGEASDGES